ncbi:MAG: penicillin-binding transpeptidase domain-containing protein [Syntrophothermus sp.]
MKTKTLILLLFVALNIKPQEINFQRPFNDCNIKGSTTIFDYQNKKWIYTDSSDALKETLPASSFKIINTLIALEEGLIKDENEVLKWTGDYDSTLYGSRPEIYKDMSTKEAFQLSSLWVYTGFAKKIGNEKYRKYLKDCGYGNGVIYDSLDFWNFGPFGISPKNQIEFLIKLYENKLPFSKRNMEIVKNIMINPEYKDFTIRAKTGWTRAFGYDTGWWVGYSEKNGKIFFFATRLIKKRTVDNPNFAKCRKTITLEILKQVGAI